MPKPSIWYFWSPIFFSQATLPITSGAAFSVAWLRRADRRAGFLAAFAFASAPLFSPRGLPLAVSGLVWLCACTPRVSRKLVATAGAIAFALCAASANAGSVLLARTELASSATDPPPLAEQRDDAEALTVQYAVIGLACAWAVASALRERASLREHASAREQPPLREHPSARDELDPDRPFLFDVLLAACVLLAVYGLWTRTAGAIEPAPILLAPAALWYGATFVRADRTAPAA